MKILKEIKARLESNIKVPHPTLVAIGISVAISATIVGIFYIADSNGMFGSDDAFAKSIRTRKGDGNLG